MLSQNFSLRSFEFERQGGCPVRTGWSETWNFRPLLHSVLLVGN